MSQSLRMAATLGLLVFLAACAYRGDLDQPATIKATWFSYLGGDDIREACGPGSPLRIRLVYNADYNKHLRAYDLLQPREGADAGLISRVHTTRGIDIARFSLQNPFAVAGWDRHETTLSPREVERLEQALYASGALGGAPDGLTLRSQDTFWTLAMCRNGQFHFNAWSYPSKRYGALAFPDVLFALDPSRVRPVPPTTPDIGQRFQRPPRVSTPAPAFRLTVRDGELAGGLGL